MKKFFTRFDVAVVSSIFFMFFVASIVTKPEVQRSPSSDETFELHIRKMNLPQFSRLMPAEKVFVKATFDKIYSYEFGKDTPWNLSSGSTHDMDLKLDIKSDWIRADDMEFKLEIVKKVRVLNLWDFEVSVFKCATVSKEISKYNRGYQCYAPGEKNAILTYRVAKKGAPLPGQKPIQASR